jgi:hypothetical protein
MAIAGRKVTEADGVLYSLAWGLAAFMELGGVCVILPLIPFSICFALAGVVLRPQSGLSWVAAIFTMTFCAIWQHSS